MCLREREYEWLLSKAICPCQWRERVSEREREKYEWLLSKAICPCQWRVRESFDGHTRMGGTFRATAGFQDLDSFQKAIKNGFDMHFECYFSPFRIET